MTTQQQLQTSSPRETLPEVTVSNPDGYLNGHGYVDLGLPSGLKWATCNVGANTPEEYGDYFSVGETAPKSPYTKTYGKSVAELKSEGIVNPNGDLTKSYDAASSRWESSWRMPTKKECDELAEKCEWQRARFEGINGCRVTGPNGKSIFLPAAGYYYGSSSVSYAGESGFYLSSTVVSGGDAYSLCFYSSGHGLGESALGYYYSVRPVSR